MPFQIDWFSFTLGFAISGVLFNLIQIVSAFTKIKKAQADKKRIESDIESLQKTIESTRKELQAEMDKEKKKRENK